MTASGPRGVLRVGDRVRFDGQVHLVAGLAGTTVRLQGESGGASLVLFSHLLAADGFEMLDSLPEAPGLPSFGLLDTVPEPALRRARLLERHMVEMETGLLPGAEPTARPRPEYDPKWRTVNERIAAKAEELAALGTPMTARTLFRLRGCWREQGLWGLVDHRATRVSKPTGHADERLVTAITEALAGQEKLSTGTRSRVLREAERILVERHGEGAVELPSRSTLYRLVRSLSEGMHSFGTATARRSRARRPQGVFTPSKAARPGEVVQIDTTPLDVLAILDDGVTGRVELTIAVDVATRTICAAVLRPAGTKAVDAALLLARILVPEPMRPGWHDALRMSVSLIPHARLMSVDARLEHAAAKPVIVPDTIVVDHGKVFISETFVTACQTLGVSVQPARPATPTDKGVVERTFSSINTLFCQHVAGYVGSNPTRRGEDVQAVWTLRELADLFDEWVVARWQTRPHDSLRSPFLPGQALSPNDVYAMLVARSGHLPVCLTGDDYIELLPAEWRKINDYGVVMDYRTYDCRDLAPYRRQPSGVDLKGGLWEVHYDPYDLSHIWIRDHRAGGWITVPWTRLDSVSAPFADFTWRHARSVLAAQGADDTDEGAIAAVVEDLLTRAQNGPDRKVAARTHAAASHPVHPGLRPALPEEPQEGPEDEDQPVGKVIPFGVFDAFTDGSRP
ncbi:Mu transposase C-terminal domain-containing protein [Streptomyces sp. NL15-2K]|uniref:Mu transposase C-terminal domain-containing protein n=1 Tax=Streptomyces sp. NL15-2K TaxID=376149 RepID=UPI000F57DDB6|nr:MULTISPECIES: Mu transposase C-terminal domain-containing protein [Actinomycetes]WKX08073.1 Mu transposase C-terminal domain-containing protein [Kutzneria buriramensis]WKX10023.1 Mu transposase C-terminal domain-containing protein [Kutzneria buriramensis]WKX11648.1 Mu transposase C-terminal domain-containing protein [Kutzneria buriramensis]WKX12439.1 Mu transposase C-terminal domain-containing protein [Kutzneria buriramensis]WKX15836.1 Mu transposase C-terminal domain-containing protein [Ku